MIYLNTKEEKISESKKLYIHQSFPSKMREKSKDSKINNKPREFTINIFVLGEIQKKTLQFEMKECQTVTPRHVRFKLSSESKYIGKYKSQCYCCYVIIILILHNIHINIINILLIFKSFLQHLKYNFIKIFMYS